MVALVATGYTDDDNLATGGDWVLAKPVGTVVGDVLLASGFNQGGGTPTNPAITGFTSQETQLIETGTLRHTDLTRVVDGSEGGSFTATLGVSASSGARMFRIKDASVEASGQNTGSGTTLTMPSVSAGSSRCLAIAHCTNGAGAPAIQVLPSNSAWFRLPNTTYADFWYARYVDAGQSSGAATVTVPAGGSGEWAVNVILFASASQNFPQIAGWVNELGTSLGSTNAQPTFAAPNHAAASGDLVIYVVGVDTPAGTAISASTGWTVLDQTVNGAEVTRGALVARILDGTADDTLSLTGASQDYVAIGCIIPAAEHGIVNVSTDIVRGTPSQAASGNTDPPPLGLNPSRWLVFAAAVVDAAASNAITGWPAEFGLVGMGTSVSSASSIMVALAALGTTLYGVDPGAFAHNSQENIGFTFAVRVIPEAMGALWNSGARRI